MGWLHGGGRRARVAAGLLGAGAVAAVALAACHRAPSGPTAAQAGARLAGDSRYVLDELRRLRDMGPYTVTQDAAADQPCGAHRARRAFAASGTLPPRGTLDDTLDALDGLTSGLLSPRGYRQTGFPDADNLSKRTTVMADEQARTQVTAVLTPSGSGVRYDLSGATGCLRTR
jgi:hypothetical protein